MNVKPEQSRAAAQSWITFALEDLVEAKRTMGAPDGSVRHACINAQQAAEKAIKGVLCDAGVRIPRIHDLPRLVEELPHDRAETLKARLTPSMRKELDRLSHGYSAFRYPSDMDQGQAPEPAATREDAKSAVGLAEAVTAWARAELSPASEARDDSAQPNESDPTNP